MHFEKPTECNWANDQTFFQSVPNAESAEVVIIGKDLALRSIAGVEWFLKTIYRESTTQVHRNFEHVFLLQLIKGVSIVACCNRRHCQFCGVKQKIINRLAPCNSSLFPATKKEVQHYVFQNKTACALD